MFACGPEKDEEITTDAGTGRLDKSKDSICSNRCVDCISTRFNDVERNLGGQGLTGRSHCVLCEDL